MYLGNVRWGDAMRCSSSKAYIYIRLYPRGDVRWEDPVQCYVSVPIV